MFIREIRALKTKKVGSARWSHFEKLPKRDVKRLACDYLAFELLLTKTSTLRAPSFAKIVDCFASLAARLFGLGRSGKIN